mmetsp:Transcript_102875/g.286504  ORF Transcript_102875/g.286504 Transcript_102875/m.286504 type:complete len:209 (+) Transcript_102875:163-789(+)
MLNTSTLGSQQVFGRSEVIVGYPATEVLDHSHRDAKGGLGTVGPPMRPLLHFCTLGYHDNRANSSADDAVREDAPGLLQRRAAAVCPQPVRSAATSRGDCHGTRLGLAPGSHEGDKGLHIAPALGEEPTGKVCMSTDVQARSQPVPLIADGHAGVLAEADQHHLRLRVQVPRSGAEVTCLFRIILVVKGCAGHCGAAARMHGPLAHVA